MPVQQIASLALRIDGIADGLGRTGKIVEIHAGEPAGAISRELREQQSRSTA